MLTSVPNITLHLLSLSLQTINGKDVFDDAGLPYVYGASKILDMLGYGTFLDSSNTAKAVITKAYLGWDKAEDAGNPLIYAKSQTVNLLPLLAYQKIYYDFFSESQWEKHLAYSYNVDYWDGKSQLNLAPEMLQLRYANYPKDYFMGMIPNSQYGSVALLPSLNSGRDANSLVVHSDSNNPASRLQWTNSTSVSLNTAPSTTSPYAESEFIQRMNQILPPYFALKKAFIFPVTNLS